MRGTRVPDVAAGRPQSTSARARPSFWVATAMLPCPRPRRPPPPTRDPLSPP